MAKPTNFLVLLQLLLVLASCGPKQETQAAAPPPAVGVRQAEVKGVARAYEFVGRIQATDTVALRARVEGFLDQVLFKEGQDVQAGDLLYQMESAPYQAEVDQAKANVAAAQAELENAQLQFRRSSELLKHQNASKATVDRDKAAMETARAKVLQTEAVRTRAEINLGYTSIRAPIDGRIGLTSYTQGNLVNAGSGVLATIVSQDPIYAVFPVSQRQLEEIRKSRRQEDGTQIKIEIVVRLPSGAEYPHAGVWNYTDVTVNQQTDTLVMRATLPNPERQLTDGEFITVLIRERKEQPRLVIPQAALQLDQAGSYVLVVNPESTVEQRRVSVATVQDADAVIDSGLKQGEQIIVDGIQKVRPGQKVTATALSSGG